jgi:hypothetical protein
MTSPDEGSAFGRTSEPAIPGGSVACRVRVGQGNKCGRHAVEAALGDADHDSESGGTSPRFADGFLIEGPCYTRSNTPLGTVRCKLSIGIDSRRPCLVGRRFIQAR